MITFQERLANERRRLIEGPAPDEKPGELGTWRFVAWCSGNAKEVLDKVKAVLLAVNENSAGEWPSVERWRELLPGWFVARCARELTQEEAEAEMARWRAMSREERIRFEEERPWSVGEWIYWFQPDYRDWFWWDAKVVDDKVLVIDLEVDEWPYVWFTLDWLLRAAGAEKVEGEY